MPEIIRSMPMKKVITIALALLITSALAPRAEDAKAVWEKAGAKCHGKDGKGDTKMGQKLKVKDYTDAKVQAERKDEEMSKIIHEGKKVDGKTQMKAYGGLLKDDEIKALVKFVRDLKK